jgi:transcriptional/translational regulatory protein YebC/TACO1
MVAVDEGDAATLFKLIDTLDDDDDVQTVWGNYEVSDEVMEKLG